MQVSIWISSIIICHSIFGSPLNIASSPHHFVMVQSSSVSHYVSPTLPCCISIKLAGVLPCSHKDIVASWTSLLFTCQLALPNSGMYGLCLETPMYQLVQNLPTNICSESLLTWHLPLTRDDSEWDANPRVGSPFSTTSILGSMIFPSKFSIDYIN
mgnify:FL=1